ncbi:MAG: tol-pal system protein YbgF [Pseudomonadota bacterium]
MLSQARSVWIVLVIAVAMDPSDLLAQTAENREQAARYEARLLQLEEQIRTLRGVVERLEFQSSRREAAFRDEIDALRRELAPMVADRSQFEGRVDGDASVRSQIQAGDSDTEAGNQDTSGSGVISRNALLGLPSVDVPESDLSDQSSTSPSANPSKQYQQALGLLQAGEWANAQSAFEAIVRDHPDDPRAPTSAYWLGETYFAQGDYGTAAAIFAKNYRTYGESSPKSPDNLLKLAVSLTRLGDVERACQTFERLDQQTGGLSLPIRQAVERERRIAGC